MKADTNMDRDLCDYQKQYASQPFEKHQTIFRYREIKKIVSERLDATILEIGCGQESVFPYLDSFAKFMIVEPIATFSEKARQDAAKQSDKNIVIINTTLESLPDDIKDIKFDFILLSCLLHEIPDPKLFLREILGLCRADTIVHINVPNAGSFHRRLAVEMGLIKNLCEPSAANVQFQQHTVFDADLLRQLTEESGFAVQTSGAYMLKPFTHQQMQNMLDSGLLTEEMLEGFYAMGATMPDFCSEIYVNAKRAE